MRDKGEGEKRLQLAAGLTPGRGAGRRQIVGGGIQAAAQF